MRRRLAILCLTISAFVFAAIAVEAVGFNRIMAKLTGHKPEVAEVVDRLEARVDPIWRERFTRAGIAYPPETLTLLAFKQESKLEVWARSSSTAAKIHIFDIVGQSGGPGPKLHEGDKQVPEGVYKIKVLNPLSRFHLSLGLDYPNEFDWARAREDGRTEPGTHIYIHGGRASVGCLALGDRNIEELFYLVAMVAKENVQVVIAPNDARDGRAFVRGAHSPAWLPELHRQIRNAWVQQNP